MRCSFLTGCLLLVAGLTSTGCGDRPKQDLPDIGATSPADYFNKTMEGWNAPTGSKFKKGTAKDVDGKVVWHDNDGKKWENTPRAIGKGYVSEDTKAAP